MFSLRLTDLLKTIKALFIENTRKEYNQYSTKSLNILTEFICDTMHKVLTIREDHLCLND